jgi:hypothetical protein
VVLEIYTGDKDGINDGFESVIGAVGRVLEGVCEMAVRHGFATNAVDGRFANTSSVSSPPYLLLCKWLFGGSVLVGRSCRKLVEDLCGL